MDRGRRQGFDESDGAAAGVTLNGPSLTIRRNARMSDDESDHNVRRGSRTAAPCTAVGKFPESETVTDYAHGYSPSLAYSHPTIAAGG